MAEDFYPFVDNGNVDEHDISQVRHPARIAVYDDAAAAPRVVVVEPQDVRSYLEEITLQVTQLAAGQGGTIPFMVIREIVENLIHAYFMEPTVSILDGGNTIRFSDQGPGIASKELAMQYGTTSATEEMRRYIRGVGSGLPYVKQYMRDKGGSLTIEDNISGGTVVTISTTPTQAQAQPNAASPWENPGWQQGVPGAQGPYTQAAPQQGSWPQAAGQPGWPQQGTWGQQGGWPAPQQQQQQAPTWPTQQQGTPQPWTQAPSQVSPYAQGTFSQGAPGPVGPATSAWPTLTVRARAVLDYLSSHDSVGPSDLSREYGESQPTWTRELQSLEEAGLVRKDGQKRRLTAMGQRFLAQG